MNKMFIYSEVVEKNMEEGSYTVLASNDVIDRMDEVIDPKGWDLENYRKNPVILFAHNYSAPPVGKALWTKRTEIGLMAKIKFANTPMGQEIRQLIDEGILNAVSVGFQPTESSTDEDVISQYSKAKKPRKPCRKVYLKQELLEISVVPVPANPTALFERAKSLSCKELIDEIEMYKKSLESKEEVEDIKETEEVVDKGWDDKPNEIRHRINDPGKYETFRYFTLKKSKPKIFGVYGKIKGEDKWEVQSLRFPKADGWTMESAKKWVADHPSLKEFLEYIFKCDLIEELLDPEYPFEEATNIGDIKVFNGIEFIATEKDGWIHWLKVKKEEVKDTIILEDLFTKKEESLDKNDFDSIMDAFKSTFKEKRNLSELKKKGKIFVD